MPNKHDPVMLAGDFLVLVVVLIMFGRLVRVFLSDPFPKELVNGAKDSPSK
jgi:hypothetical protein